MSTRVLLFVIMYTLGACTPRKPSTSTTTLRLTAQRNDTGMWSTKFGDYQMIIEHKHFNKNSPQEEQDGTWTLKVKHTTTVFDVTDEDADRQMVMDILAHYNNPTTTMKPEDNQFGELDEQLKNNDSEQTDTMASNSKYGQIDRLFTENEYGQTDQYYSNKDYGQVDQLSSNNEHQRADEFSRINQHEQVDQLSTNNGNEQYEQLPGNNEFRPVDQLSSNEYGQVDELFSDNQYGQVDQLPNIDKMDNITSVEESGEEQMTSAEREHHMAEEERKLIMDRYPRSRSLGYDMREFELEAKGYRYYSEVGWVKLNTAHWQWDQASESCEVDGGYLAVPDTLQKIKIFTRILKDNVDIIDRAVLRNQVFVGVYVPYNNRRFITVKGEPFIPESVSIWFPNEPNDADPGEDCVTLHLEGKLRDVPCFYNLPFLCQIH